MQIDTDIRHYDAERVIEEAEMRRSKVGVCIVKIADRIFSTTNHPFDIDKISHFVRFSIFLLRNYGASVRLFTHSPQEGWHTYKEFNQNGCYD